MQTSNRLTLLAHLDGLVRVSAQASAMARRLIVETDLPLLRGLSLSAEREEGILIRQEYFDLESSVFWQVRIDAMGEVTVTRWLRVRDVREVAEFLGLTP